MRRHWQKRPLLVRAALPGVPAPVSRAELFRLATRDDVESRLVQREGAGPRAAWTLQRGPLPRRALPPVDQPGWTLLVQGLDLHVPAAQALLARFRFIPQARLDDVMVSWASPGGGVGPHVDSYDVFLVQVHGQRRWRIGPVSEATPPLKLRAGVPLKMLANFKPQQEWLLGPGDLLYLPPGWAHDGDAVGGDCMTCSVGFRSATASELARETLLRLADAVSDAEDPSPRVAPDPDLYRDPGQPATATPGLIPAALMRHARQSLMRALREPDAMARALGEYLSEPKPQVQFTPHAEAEAPAAQAAGVVLDACSCMLYDDSHVFLNGESWRASGSDAQVLRKLADQRQLDAADLRRASKAVRAQIDEWLDDGWLQPRSLTTLGL